MPFEVTPEEAQRTAVAVMKYFRRRKVTMRIERKVWDDAPYRTTLSGTQSGLQLLIEAQGAPAYGGTLKALATWLAARRYNVEFCVAIPSDGALQAGVLEEMRRDGVGLFVVEANGSVRETQKPRNPALVVNPEPTLRFGPRKSEVDAAIKKFNDTDRKDGLRDMCELVERHTEDLGATACKKGWLKTPEAQFRMKDWSSQINELARPEVYESGRAVLITPALKDDLQSFRGARNLVDHPPRTKHEDRKRQKQYTERMVQGPRLVAELVAAHRRVKK